jgi:hypothetical protein
MMPVRGGCDKVFEGIIWHLTQIHRGIVHDKVIVTITSRSVSPCDPDNSLRNVAEFNDRARFFSENGVFQWVCWDFHEIRVWPTHYTIRGYYLKSWVLEGSLDGENWTEIDARHDEGAAGTWVGTFPASNVAEYSVIPLK